MRTLKEVVMQETDDLETLTGELGEAISYLKNSVVDTTSPEQIKRQLSLIGDFNKRISEKIQLASKNIDDNVKLEVEIINFKESMRRKMNEN